MPIKLHKDSGTYKKGLLSVIKLTIPYTDERINVGVVLQNTQTGEIKIKTIEDYKTIQKCFQISDFENIEYSLDILNKRQANMDSIFEGNLSPSIIVSSPSKYEITKSTIEEELLEIYFSKVTISKNKSVKRNLNRYSKTTLISNIKKEIKEKKLDKIIKTRKHIDTIFGESKEISFTSYSKDNPIVVSQLISIYVDFWNTFNNALLLKYIDNTSITDRVIYMPLSNGTAGLTDKVDFVKDQSRKEGFKLIDSADSKELLEFMKSKAQSTLI